MRPAHIRCDIFCAVIDNFGDAGVSWRLARQLCLDFGWQVRLLIDDPRALAWLAPVEFRPPVVIADASEAISADSDVVIEAFACQLPARYQLSMANRQAPPVWLNLEYLSAEAWVTECHGMSSPHPQLPLIKNFYFPGFDENSGGLLRENNYQQRKQEFDERTFRDQFGLPPKLADELVVSLFSYSNPVLPALYAAWADSPRPVLALLPGNDGMPQQQGNLRLYPLPYLSQQNYDQLLWTSDLNFVRGEDSFVRAQLAGKPMVWQIYPQSENTHWNKLDNFLARYLEQVPKGMQSADTKALSDFWRAWNGRGKLDWPSYHAALPELQQHAQQWANSLAAQSDLATRLVRYCLARLK